MGCYCTISSTQIKVNDANEEISCYRTDLGVSVSLRWKKSHIVTSVLWALTRDPACWPGAGNEQGLRPGEGSSGKEAHDWTQSWKHKALPSLVHVSAPKRHPPDSCPRGRRHKRVKGWSGQDISARLFPWPPQWGDHAWCKRGGVCGPGVQSSHKGRVCFCAHGCAVYQS